MIKAIFTDLGGVVLTNGWDHEGRARAVERFHLDPEEFNHRHEMVFGGLEEGKMSIEDYLRFSVFHCPRDFSMAEFIGFMKELSVKLPGTMELLKEVKSKYKIPIFALSNESRELGEYRIDTFDLRSFLDAFIVSGFVGMRKPALGIYKLALDLVQLPPDQVLYIDDRPVLIEAGERAGLVTCRHTSAESTALEMARLGLFL